jgi:arsenate reductase
MAEGLVNHELAGSWTALSAGTSPAERVHPLAVRAMAEIGIELAGAQPKPVEPFLQEPWDLVITVCDSAQESCPVFPRPAPRLHLPFYDPARASGTEDERLAVFRRVRDLIREGLLPTLRERAG